MSTPNEKLAAALKELSGLQHDSSRVFASKQLTRTSRERLLKHGFLQEVMRGWLMSASPAAMPGDTTPWFASFWEFCRRYCDERFGTAWNLSPEQSLLLHAENTTIPKQVIIHSPVAGNNRIDLLFGTSFFALRSKATPPARDLEIKNGLRVYGIAAALTRVPEDFFARYPIETQVVAASVREPSQLLSRLLEGGHATIAGRLAGLFRRLGQPAIADEILATMKAADHDVREADPLDADCVISPPAPSTSPIVARLQTLWAAARDTVIAEFPKAEGLPEDRDAYLQAIDDVYKIDAYHSLSIEGYQVTPELIQRVATGAWDPDQISSDRDNQNALAARGYWLAFQRVRETVKRILLSEASGQVVRTAHRDWYREMFGPHVAARLLSTSMLAGYRNAPVYLRGSRHVPPRWELLADAMPALFDLIEKEPEPAVRAVLGHWLFGYVHPFPDGNGRIARFLMNTLLAAGGYPWTVIRVEDRTEYLGALETASAESDVQPFARFVAHQMQRTQGSSAANAKRRP
ncbi:MAG: filamentation induced by cAMP protein Fic [Deltaproteobacteria bacterium]|nr:filamentation induced by cAMP protein Fic [Deltaproteobacteria bacterium]